MTLLLVAVAPTAHAAKHSICHLGPEALGNIEALRNAELRQIRRSDATQLPLSTLFRLRDRWVTLESLMQIQSRLILEVALQLEPGMNIFLEGHPSHFYNERERSFAGIFTAEAYQLGARFIRHHPINLEADAMRILHGTHHSPAEYLPSGEGAIYDEVASLNEPWTILSLAPAHELFRNVGPEASTHRIQTHRSIQTTLKQKLNSRKMQNEIPWSSTVVPTFHYAQNLFPNSSDQPLQKLYRAWELQIQLLGLDHPDPVQYWKDKKNELQHRAKKLEEFNFVKLEFESRDGKTNLKVDLIEAAGWSSAIARQPSDGHEVFNNFPSYEVFSSPHSTGVSGVVYATRPVDIRGIAVEGLWIYFRRGLAVGWGADRGQEAIDRLFLSDPQSRRVGEIALVGADSPINQLGVVTFESLFDENAASHLALGWAYPLKHSHLSPKQQSEMGFNQASNHVDVPFGSADMRVRGVRADGTKVTLMRNGHFTKVLASP